MDDCLTKILILPTIRSAHLDNNELIALVQQKQNSSFLSKLNGASSASSSLADLLVRSYLNEMTEIRELEQNTEE
jgi:hypothetical protein